jgi:predicted MFS family arabinose efflux permease
MTMQSAKRGARLASLPALMTISVLTRLLVNTANQLFFPFLAVMAAGMGTDVVVLGRLLGLRSLMGIFALLFDGVAERWGYRSAMRSELLIGIVGLVLVGASPNLWVALLGMLLMGLGFYSFVPTLRAYLSFQIPYAQRARGFGILEYSWALSGIVGLYIMGQLIDWLGWRAPFFVLAAGLLVAWLVFAHLPPTEWAAAGKPAAPKMRLAERVRQFFTFASNRRSAWAAILAGTVVNFGVLHIFTVYGVWLADGYGLEAGQLGTVALVFGAADLCGSVLVSLVTDRLGKRRSVLGGLAGCLVLFLLLPVLNRSLVWAVAALALSRFCFEFSTVSHMSLVSEQVPSQRGKVVTLSFAFGVVGAALSGFTGPLAYAGFGVIGLAPVGAVAIALGYLLIWRWVNEPVDGEADPKSK